MCVHPNPIRYNNAWLTPQHIAVELSILKGWGDESNEINVSVTVTVSNEVHCCKLHVILIVHQNFLILYDLLFWACPYMFKVNLIVCQVLSAVCQFNSIEEAVSAVQIVLQSGVPIARIGWC